MTFLPVIERELRVAARRPGTYWIRVAAALIGLGVVLLFSGFDPISTRLGATIFAVQTWLSLGVALLAGAFLTADCLSEEKRAGTLGLLFLTDLRGYDVVLGKLTATSLRAVYGLMALFPVLAIALLMGGVSGAQFWKSVLALLNALFFSLAAGMYISSISRDAHKAMNATFLLVVFFAAGLPLIDLLFGASGFKAFASFASPAFTLGMANTTRSGEFWISALVVNAIGLVFLSLASFNAPRVWTKPVVADPLPVPAEESFSVWANQTVSRTQMLDKNPVTWLMCRKPWGGALLPLSIMILGIGIALTVTFAFGGGKESAFGVGQFFCGAMTLFFYMAIASKSVRFFSESVQSGTIELLLASPLSGAEIVHGQWRALRQIFSPAVLTLLLTQFLLGLGQIVFHGRLGIMRITSTFEMPAAVIVLSLLAQVLSTVLTLAAVAWMGIWCGLTSKKASGAVLKTLLVVVVGPPFALSIASAYLIVQLSAFSIGPWVVSLLMTVANIALAIAFIRWAKRRLECDLRERLLRMVGASSRLDTPNTSPLISSKPA